MKAPVCVVHVVVTLRDVAEDTVLVVAQPAGPGKYQDNRVELIGSF
jgi:hypothetical protein